MRVVSLVLSISALLVPAQATAAAVQAASPAAAQAEAAEGIPLISLSYPAVITPAARALLKDPYAGLKWPGGCGNFMSKCPENADALDHAIVRTTYYMPDVYRALSRRLPKGSVVLQPAILDVDATGNLSYRVANPDMPSVIRLDFLAHVGGRIAPGSPSTTLYTHGRFVLPAFVAARPATGELIAVSKGLSTKPMSGEPSVLIRLAQGPEKTKSPGKLLLLESKQQKISDEAWKHLDGNGADSFADDPIEQVLQPFLQQLDQSAGQGAAPAALAQYRRLYEQELAKAGPVGEALIPTFFSAEREFSAQLAENAMRAIRVGDFGSSVRKVIKSERDHNKKVNTSSWIGGLTALAGGVSAMGTAVPIGPQMLMAMAQQETSLREANSAYGASFGAVAAEQRSVALAMGDREQVVHAGTIADLRTEFRKLLVEIGTPKKAPAKKKKKKRGK